MIIRLTVLGRELLALDVRRGDHTDPVPATREQPGPGQTLRLDTPPQRLGYRATHRPLRADHQEESNA